MKTIKISPNPNSDEGAVTYNLPKLKKKIFYFDQCIISNMMKAISPKSNTNKKHNDDQFSFQLFKKILRLCKMQKAICIESEFHRNESLVSPFYFELKHFYEQLSYGISFFNKYDIERIQVLEHARNWIEGKIDFNPNIDINSVTDGNVNEWQDRIRISVDFNFTEDLIKELRKDRERKDEIMSRRFLQWKNENGLTFEKVYEREGLFYGKTILESFNESIWALKENIQLKPNQIKSLELVSQIIILFKTNVSSEERLALKIREYFNSPIFDKIPFVKISSLFLAGLARQAKSGRVKPPNQGMANDLFMVSCVLPYCDILFVDKECAALLSENPTCKKLEEYKTRIFSLNTKNELLKYLEEIEVSNQQPDIKLIEEVYGKDWMGD